MFSIFLLLKNLLNETECSIFVVKIDFRDIM